MINEEFFEYLYPRGEVEQALVDLYGGILQGNNPSLVLYHLK